MNEWGKMMILSKTNMYNFKMITNKCHVNLSLRYHVIYKLIYTHNQKLYSGTLPFGDKNAKPSFKEIRENWPRPNILCLVHFMVNFPGNTIQTMKVSVAKF